MLVLGSLAAAAAHRLLGESAGAVAGLLASALALTWVYALPEAFLGLLPGTETVQRFVDLAVQGGETIASSTAPAPATPGLRMVVVAGLALVWWTVDLVAVVLRRPAVAGLALLAVYCVPTALVRSGLPWWWFVLAAAGYLVLVASDAQERVSRWGRVVGSSGSGDVEERASLSATGRRVGALALAAAVVVPALVPGLSESLLPAGNLPGNGPGDGTIAVLNPILSLRDDLTANDDVTVLEYTTEDPTPDPLRLVTVDSFDGDTWQPTYGDIDRDQRAAGNFPAPPGLAAAAGRDPGPDLDPDRRAAAGLAAHALPADPDRHHRQLALRRDHPQRRRRRRADHRGPALLRAAPAGRARPGGPRRRRTGAGRHRHPLDGAARRARPRPSPPRPRRWPARAPSSTRPRGCRAGSAAAAASPTRWTPRPRTAPPRSPTSSTAAAGTASTSPRRWR